MDMEGMALDSGLGDSGLWKSGKAKKSPQPTENAVDFEAVKAAEAKAAEEIDDDELRELLKLTPVERADLIDEISRKAFVLMEAGEITEAREHLDRVTRIGAAFQRLDEVRKPKKQGLPLLAQQDEAEQKTKQEYTGKEGEDAVLRNIRQELHKDDLTGIFAGRYSHFIGGW